jgi:hypothetical protein
MNNIIPWALAGLWLYLRVKDRAEEPLVTEEVEAILPATDQGPITQIIPAVEGTVYGFTYAQAMMLGLPITNTNNWKVVSVQGEGTWMYSDEEMASYVVSSAQLALTPKTIVAAPGESANSMAGW